MMFIAIKTKDGVIKGKLSFYCRMLGVSRQGFYKYLAIKDRPWKYQDLADAMRVIHAEDECNDTYGRIRMYQALLLKNPTGIKIPSERTVYRVMDEIGLVHRPKRKPNGITKADTGAGKELSIDCTLEVTEGTAKVFWISGSDEAVTLIETTGTYSDTITLPDGGNYIGIECENFTGNIELNIE
jgi:hypothetical protein